MSKKKLLLLLPICIMSLFLVSSIAGAIPMADLVYVEIDIGGGWYRYDYTAYNFSDAGESLWDIGFWFDKSATFVWLSIPSGWSSVYSMVPGFEEVFSTDFIYDIAAGDSLSEFSFNTNYQAGDIVFDAYFSDAQGGFLSYRGFTRGSSIPEPSTLLLLGSGLFALGYFIKRKNRIF
jgi:hypothetical protein